MSSRVLCADSLSCLSRCAYIFKVRTLSGYLSGLLEVGAFILNPPGPRKKKTAYKFKSRDTHPSCAITMTVKLFPIWGKVIKERGYAPSCANSRPFKHFGKPGIRNTYEVKQTLSVLLKPSLNHKITGLLATRNFNWNGRRQTWVCV